jgi:hypothetical protein
MLKKTGVNKGSQGKSHVIKTALQELMKCMELQNKWMMDEVWIEIINDRFNIPTGVVITTADLNSATSRDPAMKTCIVYTMSNCLGMYKACYEKRVSNSSKQHRSKGG